MRLKCPTCGRRVKGVMPYETVGSVHRRRCACGAYWRITVLPKSVRANGPIEFHVSWADETKEM